MLAIAATGPIRAAEVSTSVKADTGLRAWKWQHQGISLQLVQRLPDQTRAFFLGRGFSAANADRIARACVFQTIFRNDGQAVIDYDLNDWQVITTNQQQGQQQDQQQHPLQTRERWQPIWQQQQATQAAQIAFRWSLLPTVQRFQPGDYNWGMSSYGLPPGSRFTLSLQINIDGQTVTGQIPDIICAAETIDTAETAETMNRP